MAFAQNAAPYVLGAAIGTAIHWYFPFQFYPFTPYTVLESLDDGNPAIHATQWFRRGDNRDNDVALIEAMRKTIHEQAHATKLNEKRFRATIWVSPIAYARDKYFVRDTCTVLAQINGQYTRTSDGDFKYTEEFTVPSSIVPRLVKSPVV